MEVSVIAIVAALDRKTAEFDGADCYLVLEFPDLADTHSRDHQREHPPNQWYGSWQSFQL